MCSINPFRELLRITAVALLLSPFAVAQTLVFAQGTGDTSVKKIPSLLVSGVGEVMVKPDTAYISLGVVSHGKEASLVANQNAGKTDAVIKALIKSGTAVADIHTEDYTLAPDYAEKNGTSVFKGYAVSNSVRVIVRKIANAGKVIDAALGAGANSVDSVSFGLADPEKAQDDARVKAIADAVRKAKIAAKAAGIGSIRFVELIVDSVGSDSGIEKQLRYRPNAVMLDAPSTPIQGGRQSITATVTVRFAIVDPTPLIGP